MNEASFQRSFFNICRATALKKRFLNVTVSRVKEVGKSTSKNYSASCLPQKRKRPPNQAQNSKKTSAPELREENLPLQSSKPSVPESRKRKTSSLQIPAPASMPQSKPISLPSPSQPISLPSPSSPKPSTCSPLFSSLTSQKASPPASPTSFPKQLTSDGFITVLINSWWLPLYFRRWHYALTWMILVKQILPRYENIIHSWKEIVDDFIAFISTYVQSVIRLEFLKCAVVPLLSQLRKALGQFKLDFNMKLQPSSPNTNISPSMIDEFLPGFLCPLEKCVALNISAQGGSDYIVTHDQISYFFLYGPLSLVSINHQSSIEASINSNTNQVVIKRENSRIKENQFSVNLSKIQM
jgi:hypothetical protein